MKFSLTARFAADERGAMSFLILPMFLLLVVLAGLSLDIYIEETHREDLQDALDRGVLAAGAPHQDLDRTQIVWSYINSRTYNDKQASANIDVDDQATYTRVTAGAGFDMDTIIFSLLYKDTLPIIASSEAFEGEEKVEVSLVLDISGSMVSQTSTGAAEKRLEILKGAAKNFVTLMLARENADRISISVIPYAGQVNAGKFFNYYVGAANREWDESWAHSCVEFEAADFGTSAMPGLAARNQSPQFQNFRYEKDYGFNAEWGWCPGKDMEILALTNNEAELHAYIDSFVGHDGTGTNNGMKWGLGLLDPSMRDVITARHLDPTDDLTLSAEFLGRPYDYGSSRTKKYLIVMTDGNIRYQNRPTAEALAATPGNEVTEWDAQKWGEDAIYEYYGYTYSTARNLLLRFPDQSTLSDNTLRAIDEDLRSQQFLDLCSQAKQNGIRVFTIGFDIEEADDAFNEMRDCATVEGDFFDVDGVDLYAAFEQILQNIAKLQLTQ